MKVYNLCSSIHSLKCEYKQHWIIYIITVYKIVYKMINKISLGFYSWRFLLRTVFNLPFGSGDKVVVALIVDSSLGDGVPCVATSLCFI